MKKFVLTLIAFFLLAVPAWAGPHVDRGSATATETVAGIIELSTDAEAVAGTSASVVLTPANLRAVVLDSVADAALSGTPVIIGIIDKSGNTYYFKTYPTKTAY